ncbi:MAG: hypothetical protein DWQ07_07140 [Chloroflexi bacterium]|nr:MAG: hypothetical protein DWQ07_07140 [Chloroflexota bacterium]MBL1195523.1 hypothetical protein [Chloroflexota bacterium]NOH12805.1 YfhO family protein [Chloroflexota bacterium]
MLLLSEFRDPKTAIAHLWPLLLPLAILLPVLAGFPYASPEARFSDFSITHYPNALFLQRSILEYGQVPLWSPTILSGYPIAANPLASLWYPPHWLALLMPLPIGLNVVAVLHVLWGGVGMYLFLRGQELSHRSALFGALAFEAMPKLFAHYGAGHLTTIYAVPWIPWLLLATQGNRPRWLRPGIVLSLIFLADVRWAAYAGLLWLAYETAHSHRDWVQRLLGIVKEVGIAALLAAPLALPLVEYTRLSSRANLEVVDVLAFSLEPAQLFGYLFPTFGGYHEWMMYAGLAVFILALVTVFLGFRKNIFWLTVFAASNFYALGSSLPGMDVLAELPGFSLLRVPPRALTIAVFALIVLASRSLEIFLRGEMISSAKRRIRLFLMGMTTLCWGLTLGVGMLTGSVPMSQLWGAASLTLVTIILFLALVERITVSWMSVMLAVVMLLDMGAVNLSNLSSRSVERVLSEQGEVAEYLARQPGNLRVYSPSYSLPQQTAAYFDLELADGADPLKLEEYVEYMTLTSGVPRTGYSVPLPPFESGDGDPSTTNRDYLPDAAMLGKLSVGYVAAEFKLDVEGLELVEQFGETRVYSITNVLPRAYILKDGEVFRVEHIDWSPNRIQATTNTAGLLVLSEIAYPGWQVYVDGQLSEIQTHEGLFRAVEVGEGCHGIEFVFRPMSVYSGLVVSLLTIIVLVWRGYRTE